jgi:hypothetical protein
MRGDGCDGDYDKTWPAEKLPTGSMEKSPHLVGDCGACVTVGPFENALAARRAIVDFLTLRGVDQWPWNVLTHGDRPGSTTEGDSGPAWKKEMRHRRPMIWVRDVVCDEATDHVGNSGRKPGYKERRSSLSLPE